MARRVLIACKYLPPETEGGGALTVRALAESLVESGVEVTILKAEAKPGTTPGRVAGARIVETPYRDRFDYRDRGMPDFYGQLAAKRFNHASYRRTMLRLITETRFDLIHAQNHTTALAAASLRSAAAPPVVATLRGHGLWCFVLGKRLPDGSPCSGCVTGNQVPCLGASGLLSPPTMLPSLALMKAWMRKQDRLTRRIDLMLPISTFMADEARHYNVPMRVIPDLVRDAVARPAPLPDHVAKFLAWERSSGNHPVGLYAGRLAPNKGLDLVLEVAAQRPDWRFLIAGADARGDYMVHLESRARELDLNNVQFAGWVQNEAMPALYDAADVVLLPFLRKEPLSRGMVEALSRGRALAATSQGGPLDGVDDGRNGVLFSPTPDAFAAALDRLARSDLEAMGRQSRAIYEERFSPARIVGMHIDAYESVIQMKGGAE